jgi:monothiol glutaredoxin
MMFNLTAAKQVAKRFISTAMKSEIEQLSSQSKILVFMKGTRESPQCGFSRAVVQILNLHNVPYQTVNILESEEIRTAIKEYNNWPTIPQVMVNGEFVGGCDIMLNMHKTGELETLLIKEGLLEEVAE